ncbi:MAG: ribonuclease H-like domain-containing protein [Pseudomonadales bacterium]|jgi:DEAD/DEAH box helicase domain-containing protein|nr:ribonuclease H-like domain-containing protein [Pseudomonadales bacterium]
MLQVVLDVETKKTFDEVGGFFPEQLGISFVGVCVRTSNHGSGEMKGYFEEDLPKLFPLLEEADIVIGYNNDGFDMPTFTNYYDGNISKIPTLDLMARIKKSCGHRISLDSVAQATFNQKKTGDGLDAIKYYRTGRLKELAEYCLQDVKLTRELFDYGFNNGNVKFYNKWNRLVECNVDFTYKPRKDFGTQTSLF